MGAPPALRVLRGGTFRPPARGVPFGDDAPRDDGAEGATPASGAACNRAARPTAAPPWKPTVCEDSTSVRAWAAAVSEARWGGVPSEGDRRFREP